MDRAQEQELLINADVAAAILAVGREFRLVVLDGTPTPDPTDPEWKDARFVGCLAYTEGQVGVSLDEHLELDDLRTVSAAFLQLVNHQTDWLERLYRLPDTREN